MAPYSIPLFHDVVIHVYIYRVIWKSKNHLRTTPKKCNTNSDTKCSVSLHHTHKVINIIVVSGSYAVSTGTRISWKTPRSTLSHSKEEYIYLALPPFRTLNRRVSLTEIISLSRFRRFEHVRIFLSTPHHNII